MGRKRPRKSRRKEKVAGDKYADKARKAQDARLALEAKWARQTPTPQPPPLPMLDEPDQEGTS